MKKNGYVDVKVEIPVEGVKKGDTVYVSSTEYGQLPDDAMVTCITTDDEEVIIPKKNLKL
jgi:YbbR domain-containing protein